MRMFRIEALEDQVLAHELDDFSAPMTALRKETMAWFRYYSQLDDVACELRENENGFFTDSEQLLFHMFEDRVIRLREESQLLRESCAQLQSLFQAEIDTRQNHIMQILTIVTTIFLPLTPRRSEPLRSKVGGPNRSSPYFAGWDRLAKGG